LRQGQDGPQEAVWVAIVLGWERGTDETLAERDALGEARAAIEQHAADHAGQS